MSSHLVVVDGGRVVEFIGPLPDGFTLDQIYHADIVAQIVAAPSEVALGWMFDGGGTFLPPKPSVVDLPALKLMLKAPNRSVGRNGKVPLHHGGFGVSYDVPAEGGRGEGFRRSHHAH